MFTAEKVANFDNLIANNQPCAPEDQADFEMYKALKLSQNLAAQSVAEPTPTEVAASVPVTAASVPAVAKPETISIPTPSTGFYTMDDLISQSFSADKYLKVKHQVTSVGGEMIANKEIYGILNFSDVRVKQSIKGGNPVKYLSSLDGRTCVETGDTWMNAITEIKRRDPNARPYSCADFTVTVAKDLVSYDGQLIAPAGTRLGHTTATTNWTNWVRFWQSLPNHDGHVYVKIVREDVKKGSNQWAILNFEYVAPETAIQLGLLSA
jgi:hypothetical protein